MNLADLMPQNRREVGIALASIALAIGLSKLPGLTFEPRELTDCRTELARCGSERDGCIQGAKDDEVDYEERLERCWDRYRALKNTPEEP